MKKWMMALAGGILILVLSFNLHAQTDSSPPQFGTFFLQSYGAIPAPFPYDPYGGMEPMVQLTNGA